MANSRTVPLSVLFQFTPLREGRLLVYIIHQLCVDISIHAPPRGATGINTPDDITKLFQFTPLREGRHALFQVFCIPTEISIHAPPRGATAVI